jgi:hypothetical protein
MFQRLWQDMSDPQVRHVRPLSIIWPLSIIRLSSRVSETVAGHVRPRPGHVLVSNIPTTRFSWGAIKGPPCHSSTVGHSFYIANTLRHSLELPTSLLQASFKSKLSRRDSRLTLEWPTRSSSQALHRWSPCVRYAWGFVLLDGLGCPGVTKVVVDPRKFILPFSLWGFDSENWTRYWWSFRVD